MQAAHFETHFVRSDIPDGITPDLFRWLLVMEWLHLHIVALSTVDASSAFAVMWLMEMPSAYDDTSSRS